ncbi:hypothetical protein A0H81_09520 [Grifola frondosa]|uniref:Uncharacterized protein n=1 Tax=Grifola frondosa TaxID=5627 RepID=A0A1C7M320_GRIFR|nr:hypothetical protein A0H81_09520 [Grifola frondosa]
MDIVEFMARPEVLIAYGLKKLISLSTAQTWMHALDYQWTKVPSGQFVNSHECADITGYRDNIFLPVLVDLDLNAWKWTDGIEMPLPEGTARPLNRVVIYWYHDESTFYAHDCRFVRWVHKSEKAVLRTKGEGLLIMAVDFISADYGWLRSPDGKELVRVLFKAGKNREGYFTNEDILEHATKAMDILQRHYRMNTTS